MCSPTLLVQTDLGFVCGYPGLWTVDDFGRAAFDHAYTYSYSTQIFRWSHVRVGYLPSGPCTSKAGGWTRQKVGRPAKNVSGFCLTVSRQRLCIRLACIGVYTRFVCRPL